MKSDPRILTSVELALQRRAEKRVSAALNALNRITWRDEDIEVARARLQNWLDENAGRWVR